MSETETSVETVAEEHPIYRAENDLTDFVDFVEELKARMRSGQRCLVVKYRQRRFYTSRASGGADFYRERLGGVFGNDSGLMVRVEEKPDEYFRFEVWVYRE